MSYNGVSLGSTEVSADLIGRMTQQDVLFFCQISKSAAIGANFSVQAFFCRPATCEHTPPVMEMKKLIRAKGAQCSIVQGREEN